MDFGGPPPQRRGRFLRNWNFSWSFTLMSILILLGTPLIWTSHGENAGFGYSKGVSSWKPDNDVDFVEAMRLFCLGSQAILLDKPGFETWFNDVDANSVVIATMLEAVPLSLKASTKGYVGDISTIEKAVSKRESSIAEAKTAFESFLDLRETIVHGMISDRSLWHEYAINTQGLVYLFSFVENLNDATSATNPRSATKRKGSLKTTPRGEAHYAEMAKNITGLIDETIGSHHHVWTEGGKDLIIKNLLVASQKHLAAARVLEQQIIKGLKETSGRGNLWSRQQHGDALWHLSRKFSKLEPAYDETIENLKRLNYEAKTRNPKSITKDGTNKEAVPIWTRALRMLLTNWTTLLLSSQQGILFILRRDEMNKAGLQPADELAINASWEGWKQRNCGGTSCYDVEGPGHIFMKAIGISKNPTAGRARDEPELSTILGYSKTPSVWRNVYEKACCEEGEVTRFLKNAPTLTTLNPEMEEDMLRLRESRVTYLKQR